MSDLITKMAEKGLITDEQAGQIRSNVDEMLKDVHTRADAAVLVKEAGLWDILKTVGAEKILPTVAANALLLGGAAGVGAAVRGIRDSLGHAKGYKQMMDADGDLGEGRLGQLDSRRVQAAYKTLYSLNPTYAKDPFVAGQFVNNVASQAMVPMEAFHGLTQATKNIRDRGDDGFMQQITPKMEAGDFMAGEAGQAMQLKQRLEMAQSFSELKERGGQSSDPTGSSFNPAAYPPAAPGGQNP